MDLSKADFRSRDPNDAPELPESVVEHLVALQAPRTVPNNPGESYDLIPEGGRNNMLTSFAGLMRRQGLGDEAVRKVLLGLNHQLTEVPLPDEEVLGIVQSSARWDAEQTFELVMDNETELFSWLSDMTIPPPPEWLWRPYLPVGRLVLLDGAEGIGKGLFAVHAATRLTQGDWGRPSNVLWMTAEDDPEEDIQRRMHAAGWAPGGGNVGFFNELPRFPHHVDALGRLIEEYKASMVVMDPGRSFLAPPDGSPMSFNDDVVIRHGMESLARLARSTDCTILFVHHWNKNTQVAVQYRAGGSGAFAQVARHRVTMAWVGSTEDGVGAFEVTKSNIGMKGGLRAFDVEPQESLHTALLRVGEPISGHSDLNGWLKAAETALASGEVTQDPADALAGWFEEHLTPGGRLPPRTEWVAGSGVRKRDIDTAIAELEAEGRVTRATSDKGGRTWNG